MSDFAEARVWLDIQWIKFRTGMLVGFGLGMACATGICCWVFL